jgi:hypothetical protein
VRVLVLCCNAGGAAVGEGWLGAAVPCACVCVPKGRGDSPGHGPQGGGQCTTAAHMVLTAPLRGPAVMQMLVVVCSAYRDTVVLVVC